MLDVIAQNLRILLPNYTVWSEPGNIATPPCNISRRDYVKAILSVDGDGLIIQQPEQWLSYWPLTDKQALWSALSLWHDSKKVILVFAAGDEFQQINNAYFKPLGLDGLPIQLWRPVRAA